MNRPANIIQNAVASQDNVFAHRVKLAVVIDAKSLKSACYGHQAAFDSQ